jgi:putative peptidoglycan lipid II flippase
MSDQRDHFFSSARIVAVVNLGSRVFGLARDVVCASIFGLTDVWGAFTFAFRIPNLLRSLLGEGALNASFIPTFTRYLATRGHEEARGMFRATLTWLIAVMVVVVIAGELAIFGFTRLPFSEGTQLALRMTAILAPYALIICVTALVTGVLQSLGSFGPGEFSPIVMNIFWIAAAFAAASSSLPMEKKIYFLPIGIILGTAAAVLMLWRYLARHKMGVLPAVRLEKNEGLSEVRRNMAPVIAGLAVLQVNVLCDDIIARAFISSAANGTLYYANRLYQLPLAVFGLPVAVAVFPALGRLAAQGRHGELIDTMSRAMAAVFFMCAPAAVGIIVLNKPIVSLIFQHGAFGRDDVALVGATTAAYALGLWAYSANHLLTRASYSQGDMRNPLKFSLINVGANLTMNLILVVPLREPGLALATAISSSLRFVIHSRLIFSKSGGWRAQKALIASAGRTLIGCALLAVVVYAVARILEPAEPRKIAVAIQVAAACLAGGGAYLVYALLVKAPEIYDVLPARFRKVVDSPGPAA